jgi:biotin operon repressor
MDLDESAKMLSMSRTVLEKKIQQYKINS